MSDSLILLPLDVDPARLVRAADPMLHRLGGATMGTSWSLTLAGDADPHAVRMLVQAELDAVVGEMSQWEADSELSRFNRAEPGSWHRLSPGFWHVLRAAMAMARRTGGAFDPTLGAVVDLWGFGPATPAILPPAPDALAEARARSGWQRLTLDPGRHAVRQPGGLRLDLSGIAKGHGVDRVAGALERAGHVSFLIEVGGELRARGLKPDAQPWWVELELPPEAALPPMRVALLDMGIATSGDYRRYLEFSGARLAHSFDPNTGAPLVDTPASVTVLHAECMIADALATAITVLGVDAGLALAEEAGVAAILLHHDKDGWKRSLSARARAMAEA